MSKCSNVRRSKDVRLREAVVAARGVLPRVYPKAVRVFAFPLQGKEVRYYDFDYGIGNSEFRDANKKGRLRLLRNLKRELVEEHGFPETMVHNALLVIPAYRRAVQRAERN